MDLECLQRKKSHRQKVKFIFIFLLFIIRSPVGGGELDETVVGVFEAIAVSSQDVVAIESFTNMNIIDNLDEDKDEEKSLLLIRFRPSSRTPELYPVEEKKNRILFLFLYARVCVDSRGGLEEKKPES